MNKTNIFTLLSSVLIGSFSYFGLLPSPVQAHDMCPTIGDHLNPFKQCQHTHFVNGPVRLDNEQTIISNIQLVHNQVIGGNGGPAYVATARKMLSDGKTLQDVRIFLVQNFSEAPIQRIHNEVIGGNGGPAYVATAKKMLSDGKTLQDVRDFLIRNFKKR